MTDPRQGLPSASFLPILSKCRGAWRMVKDLPPETSAVSDFGNQVHALAAEQVEEMTVPERASMVAHASEKIWKKIATEIFGSLEGLEIWKETRFWCKDKDGAKLFSGQADKIVGRERVALITDLKSLTGQVEAADTNWQLLGLAVAFVDSDVFVADTIYAAIIQPLISRNPVLVKYSLNQLLVARRQIIRMIEEAQMEGAPLTPGTHCRLCRARAHCQAALSLPMLWTGPGLTVSTLTSSQIAELYPKLSAVESIIAALRARARELAATDPNFPYYLKEKAGNLIITDLKAAREILCQWVDKNQFNALISISTGAVRELFVDAYASKERTTKVEAGKKFLELLETCSTREEPKQTITKKEL